MNGKRLGSSGILLGVAAAAAVALVCVVFFVPWSVSTGCGGFHPCDPHSSLNLFNVASIVVLGVVALTALVLGLNSDHG
jgi:formate hydrogenlyase subunit 4